MSKDRKRQVSVDRLSKEQVDRISDILGQKLRDIADKACDEANELLKVYGLCTKIQFMTPYPKDQETYSKD